MGYALEFKDVTVVSKEIVNGIVTSHVTCNLCGWDQQLIRDIDGVAFTSKDAGMALVGTKDDTKACRWACEFCAATAEDHIRKTMHRPAQIEHPGIPKQFWISGHAPSPSITPESMSAAITSMRAAGIAASSNPAPGSAEMHVIEEWGKHAERGALGGYLHPKPKKPSEPPPVEIKRIVEEHRNQIMVCMRSVSEKLRDIDRGVVEAVSGTPNRDFLNDATGDLYADLKEALECASAIAKKLERWT
jgi:hypothetical protein